MGMVQGNKSKYLEKLVAFGFRVPKFIVVDKDISDMELLQRIQADLPSVTRFAVRSSCVEEDNTKSAMAGQFYSELAVSTDKLAEAKKRVRQSFRGAEGDIIIQEFIPSAKSGVLFTDDGEGHVLVNANFGLCKQVVEGLPCDEFKLDKKGRILQQFIPVSKEYLFHEQNEFRTSQSHDISLPGKEIRELCRVSCRIEKKFGTPQDVEWCFYQGKLYILQSRPVTRKLPGTSRLFHYDSANIAESYSGIVLPLTLSFARHIYSVVYANLLHASGVSRKRLGRHRELFDNMVSWFYGRLYYNMNSWYRMMAFIPGYRRNKVNLENMITSNIRLDIERDILPSRWFRVAYPLIVFFKLIFFNRSQQKFRGLVQQYVRDFRSQDPGRFDLESCRKMYEKFDERLISRWHIPVENDFMVMTFFGLLRKRFPDEQKLQKLIGFNSKTSEQIARIQQIGRKIAETEGFREVFELNQPEKFRMLIRSDKEISRELQAYFMEFGGRYANELKLESADIEEDPDRLFEMVKLYTDPSERKVRTGETKVSLSITDRFLVRRFKKYGAGREEMRLLRSNGFSMMRRLMHRVGEIREEEGSIDRKEDIFYLYLEEIFHPDSNFRARIEERKKSYREYGKIVPPAHFSAIEGKDPEIHGEQVKTESVLRGRGCSGGVVMGRVRIFREFHFPEKMDFDIIVARHTDPGWTPLLGIAKGLIVEHGGILSHAAIVSRELNLPSVIGVPRVLEKLKDGMEVELNGDTGIINIMNGN